MHRDAPGGQCPGDQIRGPLLLKTKFGMRMNVPSQGLNSGYLSQDWLNQFHGLRSQYSSILRRMAASGSLPRPAP